MPHEVVNFTNWEKLHCSAHVQFCGATHASNPQVKEDTRHDDAGEDTHRHTDDERDSKALDGASTELRKDDGGHQRRQVTIDDAAERLVVSEFDRSARASPVTHLFADALVDEDVGVHTHTDGERQT